MALHPLARAELEMIADNWREVHCAGSSYILDMMRVLHVEAGAGNITHHEAIELLFRISRYATNESDLLNLTDLPVQPGGV